MNEQKEKIDIFYYLPRFGRIFRKTWWLFFLLILLMILALCIKIQFFYTPLYKVSASFSVDSGDSQFYSDYHTSVTLDQLNATFPYILESGALKKIVCEELNTEVLPGNITASAVESTNLFQISVTSENAQMAHQILMSVIKNYPTVAQYIIGDTTLHMLDCENVPTVPVNQINLVRILIHNFLIGILLYGLILFYYVMSSHTIISEEDLKRACQIRCLAAIPKTKPKKRSRQKKRSLLISENVPPAFVEAFHLLCVRLLRQLKIRQWKILLVTSCLEDEGKTTTAINLALSLVQKGYQILLLDGDLRKPSILSYLSITEACTSKENIRQCLSETAVIHDPATSLDVVTFSHPAHSWKTDGLLKDLNDFFNRCRQKYDYILIDTTSCRTLQDGLLFTSYSDAALFVIRQDDASVEKIANSLEILSDANIPIIGSVITFAENAAGSYASSKYGYGKYGYGKYGKYSSDVRKGDDFYAPKTKQYTVSDK